jgi:hypothetical protein
VIDLDPLASVVPCPAVHPLTGRACIRAVHADVIDHQDYDGCHWPANGPEPDPDVSPEWVRSLHPGDPGLAFMAPRVPVSHRRPSWWHRTFRTTRGWVRPPIRDLVLTPQFIVAMVALAMAVWVLVAAFT